MKPVRSRSIIRAKPAVVNVAPRSDVNTKGDLWLLFSLKPSEGAQFVPKDRMYGSGEVPFAGPNVAGYNILYTTTDVVLANIAVAKCVRSN